MRLTDVLADFLSGCFAWREVRMVFDRIFQPFIEASPVSVMFRGTLEHVLSAERLDRLFADAAKRQYLHELTFSTCVELLGLVVTQIRPSLNAAYRARRGRVGVSVQSLYQKLAGIEPAVSKALVEETAADLGVIIQRMKAEIRGPIPGFDVRIVDGNHLAGTHHRLKELRHLGDAALPGHTLAVLNPQRQLIEKVVVCPDGHANSKPLFGRLLSEVEPKQCWIADRDFSTRTFLFGVADRRAYFVVRHHQVLGVEPLGPTRRVGKTKTGEVYEQKVRLPGSPGCELVIRRITIKLLQPTRDKDLEIHILANLPAKVTACKIADAYLARWRIEAAFYQLTRVLRCELNTLGYPEAALFGFCLAVVMYNAFSAVMAALRAARPEVATAAGKKQKLSFYYLADEIAGVWRGMALVIPASCWTTTFAQRTPAQMAKMLLWLARQGPIDPFLTNPARVKKRKKRRIIQHGGHVSTYRILAQRQHPNKP
jgi:IS4 transposase